MGVEDTHRAGFVPQECANHDLRIIMDALFRKYHEQFMMIVRREARSTPPRAGITPEDLFQDTALELYRIVTERPTSPSGHLILKFASVAYLEEHGMDEDIAALLVEVLGEVRSQSSPPEQAPKENDERASGRL